MDETRNVQLRDERVGSLWRNLWAYVDTEGNLHIDGQDLGPGVSSSGEYEWFRTFAADDVPRVLALLGAAPGADVLDVLESDWTGTRADDLEARLRESGIRSETFVWVSGFGDDD